MRKEEAPLNILGKNRVFKDSFFFLQKHRIEILKNRLGYLFVSNNCKNN